MQATISAAIQVAISAKRWVRGDKVFFMRLAMITPALCSRVLARAAARPVQSERIVEGQHDRRGEGDGNGGAPCGNTGSGGYCGIDGFAHFFSPWG